MRLFITGLLIFTLSCGDLGEDVGLKRILPPPIEADVKAIIEIPAGTLDKYELSKGKRTIEHEYKNGVPRVVQYLAYPANYGYVPNTMLAKENGGDGDPLDIFVLGAAVKRETTLNVKILGVLKLLDRGEQDDKLIAVSPNTPFWKLNSLAELNDVYPGTSEILEIWLSNYKGKGKMESKGFEEREEAMKILELAKTSEDH